MTRPTSLYLDLVRFLAALTVMLGHASIQPISDGLLWQFWGYIRTAVVVFFVLSGYVIAHVAETRERDGWSYAASRLARLYSVCLPALLLTFVADQIGDAWLAGKIYDNPGYVHREHVVLDYLLSSIFLNQLWDLRQWPGSNGPYWSLGYEAIYYLLFGLGAFMRGRWRWLAVGAVAAAAGPLILSLFPIWLLGFGCYRYGRRLRVPAWLCWAVWTVSLALLLLTPRYRSYLAAIDLPLPKAAVSGQPLLADYIDGLLFAANLIAAPGAMATVRPLLEWAQRPIRYLGTLTFAMYLFHFPLLMLFATVGPADKSSWINRALVLGAPLMLVCVIGRWCEGRKDALRQLLLARKSVRIGATP